MDAFVGGSTAVAVRGLLARQPDLSAPAIVLAETASAIRGMTLAGKVSVAKAHLALRRAAALDVAQYPFEPFVERVWELRDNVTVYDAWYVALAEALDVPLLTADRRLAQAPGVRCEVRLVRS